jgi:hypothetical protein
MGTHTARDNKQMRGVQGSAKTGDLIVVPLRNAETRADLPESALLFEVTGRNESGKLAMVLLDTFEGKSDATEEARRLMREAVR